MLQFNSLPFSFGEIDSTSYSIATKGASQPYTNNAHGSYYPTMGQPQKLQASTYRATFTISFDGIACEDKLRYARFVKQQLLTPGKLWAVQSGTELIWTNARITGYSEDVDAQETKDELHIAATFELIDGYWRSASRTRTFLCEYCPARFQDFNPNWCWDTSDVEGVCDETGTSRCLPCELALYEPPTYEGCDWKPLCYFSKYEDRILKPTAPYSAVSAKVGDNPHDEIWYERDADGNFKRSFDTEVKPGKTYYGGIRKKLPSLYSIFGVNCSNQYALKYDCDLENDFFCYDASWGRKFRLRADGNTNKTKIEFCSRTDLPTDMVRVRLVGDFVNPTVKINGDTVNIGSALPLNGVITIGFGPVVKLVNDAKGVIWNKVTTQAEDVPADHGWYEKNSKGKYHKTTDEEVVSGKTYYTKAAPIDLSTGAVRSNTPMFQILPGLNKVEVTGNTYRNDSFIYIEPVEITF